MFMFRRICNYFSKKERGELGRRLYAMISVLVVVLISYAQLELSCCYESISQFFEMDTMYIFLNIITVGAVFCIFLCCSVRLWLAELLFSLCFSLLSIVNYYTIKLHSLPLTIFELKNFRTALNVLDGYTIKIDRKAGILIFLFVVEIVILLLQKKSYRKPAWKKIIVRDFIMAAFSVGVLYFGYLSDNSIKPHNTIGWSWKESYYAYGYLASSIEMIQSSFHVINPPEKYSEDAVSKINIEISKWEQKEKPDIIVILNETFYDLKQITNVETDVPYMDHFFQLDNSIRGYAVVPTRSTNASEYELLTSNSLEMMKGITPFNVLDMQGANSVVSVMKQLGYHTIGAHSEPAINYSRARAYPAMGFDEVHFEEDFTEQEYYGNRWYETDESLYRNLIRWYENREEGIPQFIYLLTIQNHAEYEMNDPQEDIVHVKNDYGEYEDRINEFLSCIKKSDLAFQKLTDYFLTVDRPVILCMVGDHSPTLAEDLIEEQYTSFERTLRLCSTPFIIWSNSKIESKDMGYVSLNNLIPIVMEVAKLPRSPYYEYMLKLSKQVPVIAAFDMYMDANGTILKYDEKTNFSEKIRNYFYLEYHNLVHADDPLFDVTD